jgi:type II secretory pathway component PulK
MKLLNILKSENGAALAMVIISFMVISVLATSVLVLASNNTQQVVTQERGMDSYYIARSGAEAVYQALRESSSPSQLEQFETGTTEVEGTITFTEGTVEYKIIGFNDGSTRRVRITSLGTADGTSVTRKSILEFDYIGYGKIKWSR